MVRRRGSPAIVGRDAERHGNGRHGEVPLRRRRRPHEDGSIGDVVTIPAGRQGRSVVLRTVLLTRIGRSAGVVFARAGPGARGSGERGPQQRDDDGERDEAGVHVRSHNCTRRRRSALPMTETELSVMAALAQMGLIRTPMKGYSTPAATGIPSAL